MTIVFDIEICTIYYFAVSLPTRNLSEKSALHADAPRPKRADLPPVCRHVLINQIVSS